MTEQIKPATDDEIAAWKPSVSIEPYYGPFWVCKGCAARWDANQHESIPHMDYCLVKLAPRIKARIEADREKIAALEADNLAAMKAAYEITLDCQTVREAVDSLVEVVQAARADRDEARMLLRGSDYWRTRTENDALCALNAEMLEVLRELVNTFGIYPNAHALNRAKAIIAKVEKGDEMSAGVNSDRPRFARCGCPFIPCKNPFASNGGWCEHALDVEHQPDCKLPELRAAILTSSRWTRKGPNERHES